MSPAARPVSCHLLLPWLVPIQSTFSSSFFFFLLNNLPRLSLPTCQTVAAELVQHLTPFTKGANRDSCYLGEGRSRTRRKKWCFAVIWDEHLAVGVCRPLAFIWRSASSRSDTDVLRSDFKLFSPPKRLWGGKRPDDGAALKGATVIEPDPLLSLGFNAFTHRLVAVRAGVMSLSGSSHSFRITSDAATIYHSFCTRWNCPISRLLIGPRLGVPSRTDSGSGLSGVTHGCTVTRYSRLPMW